MLGRLGMMANLMMRQSTRTIRRLPCMLSQWNPGGPRVNDFTPKKAKLASADNSGNEGDDTSIVVEKCPVPQGESQGEDSNNQNQTPSQSNNNGEEPNEQVDVKTIQRIHGDQNQEIGRVIGFGGRYWGHLKKNLGYKITTPTTLDEMGEVKFVKACGAVCSIDEKGKLTAKALGYPKGTKINDKKFKFACDASGSVFAIDEDDHLLSWGENTKVPLGHGHEEKVKEPTLIKALAKFKIKQVCCDSSIAMCVTMDNRLYIWGKGPMDRPYKVKSAGAFPGNKDILSPIEITQCGQVQQIAMHDELALLLGSDGNVYSVGSNEYGQLGLGHRTNKLTQIIRLYALRILPNQAPNFNKIDQFDSIEVLKVQVGWESSAVLTKSGQVYIFGWWTKGFIPDILALYNLQLWGDKTIYTEPHLVEELTGVVDISMGSDHILALTDNNELFAWGENDFGQCGVGSDARYIPTPTRVVGLEDKEILQISAGNHYSLIKYKTKQ